MATYILTSTLETHIKNDEGVRIPIAMPNTNKILDNIKKYVKSYDRMVMVANGQYNFEENDSRASILFDSMDMTGLKFKEKIILDARNKDRAKEIILGGGTALITLSGGKCLRQMEFFNEIGLKDILSEYKGLVIGISAGTMNLCDCVMNFPEELADLDDPMSFNGCGITKHSIIPHFDGETNTYQIPCEEVDVVNDYVLPASFGHKLLGLPNGSYLLIDNGKERIFGTTYDILDGKVTRNKEK